MLWIQVSCVLKGGIEDSEFLGKQIEVTRHYGCKVLVRREAKGLVLYRNMAKAEGLYHCSECKSYFVAEATPAPAGLSPSAPCEYCGRASRAAAAMDKPPNLGDLLDYVTTHALRYGEVSFYLTWCDNGGVKRAQWFHEQPYASAAQQIIEARVALRAAGAADVKEKKVRAGDKCPCGKQPGATFGRCCGRGRRK